MKRKKVRTMLLIILSLIVIAAAGVWYLSQSVPYPEPKGKFKVGTALLSFTDSLRNEWAVSDKKIPRRFVARVWYPANPKGTETLLPIMEKEFSKGMNKLYGFPVGKEIPSHSHQNAEVAQDDSQYPILIFTHGVGSFLTQNLSSMEELAAQGYVVFSLSFPYESVVTVFPEGETIGMDNIEKFKEGMSILQKDKEFAAEFVKNTEGMKHPEPTHAMESSIALGEQYLQLYPDMKVWLDYRIQDISFLLNSLNEVRIMGKMLEEFADVENIGVFGHSFGGLTTLKLLMETNSPSIKCGIALDVPYFILDKKSDVSLTSPILFMSSDFIKIAGDKVKLGGINNYLKHFTNQPLYECNVSGAAHYNFTDMNYTPRFMKLTPMLGSIPQDEAARILSEYQKTFFNIFLKGENPEKLNEKVSDSVNFEEI